MHICMHIYLHIITRKQKNEREEQRNIEGERMRGSEQIECYISITAKNIYFTFLTIKK